MFTVFTFSVSDDSGIPSSRYDVNQMQEQFNLQRAKMRDLYMMKVSSIFYTFEYNYNPILQLLIEGKRMHANEAEMSSDEKGS